MKWLCVLLLAACTDGGPKKVDLSGPHSCGSNTCGDGQICVTEEAGSQCGVNEDAGIPPYGVISERCVDLPAACDGAVTCDCVLGADQPFCSASGRDVTWGCI